LVHLTREFDGPHVDVRRIVVREPICVIALSFVLGAVAGTDRTRAGDTSIASGWESAEQRPRGESAGVYKAQIAPHWFHGGTRFWYRNDLRGGTREFIVVDAELATRQPAFDHQKLASTLSQAAKQDFSADRLPLESIQFIDQGRAIQFSAAGSAWHCDLKSYECMPLRDTGQNQPAQQQPQRSDSQADRRSTRRGPRDVGGPLPAPDGMWTAIVKDHNVFVSTGDGEFPLTSDGLPNNAYGRLEWSPDSTRLVAWRIEPGERKEVHLIQSSPPSGGRAVLQSRPYDLPGDKLAAFELHLFDIAGRKQIRAEVDPVDFGIPRLRWNRDGRHFAYQKVDRGHQRLRVIEVDSHTGKSRSIIDERTDTFIWTAHTENLRLNLVNWLELTDEIIYASERDGWRHLYRIDVRTAQVTNQITQGDYVVRGIDRIDEVKRQVWFNASGKNPRQDPYFVHYYRVNLDGTGLIALTEGDGNHSIQWSPDHRYIVDTYSRVDMPPVSELRRVTDSGSELICNLEQADISELESAGWQPPEVFVAKGRDGSTDIWGIICRPADFDPNQKYPVIEDIYAGPHGSFVPKTFGATRRYAALTQLGFIVAKVDGMGTAHRSKAFHDVCWKNLKDAGLPDRIAWHRAVAAKYPSYDVERVGIYGNSAGGQNAAAAVLFHPDFYKVAVASCGCHDNRMDKASWNEQWMGYPVGPQYEESSNIENAHRLRGKLLLIVGEMDTNVPPESTMRFVDALIKAGKDFDLLVIPGGGHGMGGSYGQRRLQDFFVRHLLGTEPPERNQ
jgi:dipeptidyl aminopeptidase/acylaminoacyl peptidase